MAEINLCHTILALEDYETQLALIRGRALLKAREHREKHKKWLEAVARHEAILADPNRQIEHEKQSRLLAQAKRGVEVTEKLMAKAVAVQEVEEEALRLEFVLLSKLD